MTINKMIRIAACLALLAVVGESGALAQRKNPLEGQPAVRNRYELRNHRFEVGPSFGFSLNRGLRNAFTMGVKLQYNITDWLAAGADFGFGVGFDSGLAGEIEAQYDTQGEQTAWRDQIKPRFSNIRMLGDIRASFTPLQGKMGVFGKLFVNYDLFGFVGLGMAMLSNDFEGDSSVDNVSQGFRVGPAFGIGMHVYFTHYLSLGLEIKDVIFSDNETGQDQTRGLSDAEINANPKFKILVDGDDSSFENHWMFGLNVTVILPLEAKMSR